MLRRYQKALGLLLCLLAAGSFSVYKLSESPQTWFDEGLFLQIARNAMEHHPYVLRASPTELVPAGAISTVGFTVIEPIALIFRLFGIGLLQARALMVVLILLLTTAVYLFAYRAWGIRVALASTLLIATHAPLYGNGKNVLGEVPGLFLFFILLHLLHRLEGPKGRSANLWTWTGLIAGLFMATKPNFVLLLPVLFGVIWLRRKQLAPTRKELFNALVAFLLPLALNILLGFGTVKALLGNAGNYGMPGLQNVTGLTLPNLVLRNASWFFIKTTPAYVLVTGIVWLASLWMRHKHKTAIALHELVAFGFVAMTVAYFLKMPGFYRYLFVAQIITFPYFIASCFHLAKHKRDLLLAVVFSALVGFQVYQVLFSSWVAGHYQSTRTKELTEFFQNVGSDKHVFIYHAPEVVTFVRGENYSQYFDLLYFNDAFGKSQLPALEAGVPDLVVVSGDSIEKARTLLGKYKERTVLNGGSYLIYERK